MIEKIDLGWLYENFDLEEALRPPLVTPSPGPPTPLPPDGGNGPGSGGETLQSRNLSTGAIIGIILACAAFVSGRIVSALRIRKGNKDDEEFDLERQEVTNDASFRDGMDPTSATALASPSKSIQTRDVGDSWSVDSSGANTEANTSQDHLLQGSRLMTSSAVATPALGNMVEEFSESDIDMESMYDSSSMGSSAAPQEQDAMGSSPLAAMAMASTLVASNSSGRHSSSETKSTVPR